MSVVIQENDREELRRKLEMIERESKKGIRKWFHTNNERRESDIKKVIDSNLLKNCIFYSKYEDAKSYTDLTILTTTKTILQKAKKPYSATILVDGLSKRERYRFAVDLRKLKVKVRKVQGISDQSDAFIRLADAIAGFVRDYLEGNTTMKRLYEEATRRGIIRQI